MIVGAGQAGAWTAITLREADPAREIVLIGEESHPPYERPPLSKEILVGKVQADKALIRPASFYGEQRIDLRIGRRVTAIDRHLRQVLMDEETLGYDDLVLCTGARARHLPVAADGLPCVHTLRNLDDVKRIREHLIPAQRVVVIGAGFIGMEFAAAATELRCGVTVIDTADYPMARVVDRSVARVLQSYHEQRGVMFRLATQVADIAPLDGRLEVVTHGGERLTAHCIVVGIGAVPNAELAVDAGLSVEDGIVVDERGRTSDPHIFAAGDVTRHYNPLLRRHIRLESWQNAQNQAIAVARGMAGDAACYAEVPWFWTDQYENNLQIAGMPETWDQVTWLGDPASRRFTVLYTQDNRVVAGNTLNNARDMRFIKQLITGATAIDPATIAASPVTPADIVKSVNCGS